MESKKNINGYLRADGQRIVNDIEDNYILKGWGLGNWLLPEGYMWLSEESQRFDRPRRIEQVIRELIGDKEATDFWKTYRENYIQEADIKHMADLGYNSVRLPLSYRLFMTERPELEWKEEGFILLERCVRWCEKNDLYLWIDLHGAPGGQTGANIDDSIDDVPRLFLDEEYWHKGIKLWERISKIYRDNPVIGGYDLINEPIRPQYLDLKNFDFLVNKLSQWYKDCIKSIRQIDTNHLISLEGHHWATDLDVFNQKYDDNYLIHFHRYAVYPDSASLEKFIHASKRWNVPLWLGETGENKPEWFAAYYPMCVNNSIGYNLWPYKKMGRKNCPLVVKQPKGWGKIINYVDGGTKPTYSEANEILTAFLDNIKFENCFNNQLITNYTFRKVPFSLRATDFDEHPDNISYLGKQNYDLFANYKKGSGYQMNELQPEGKKVFPFDTQWDRFSLVLHKGETVNYTINSAISEIEIEGPNLKSIYCLINGETIEINLFGGKVSVSMFYSKNFRNVLSIGTTDLVELERIIFK